MATRTNVSEETARQKKNQFSKMQPGADTEKISEKIARIQTATKEPKFKLIPSDTDGSTFAKIRSSSKFRKTATMVAALTLTAPVAKDITEALLDMKMNSPAGTELMAQTKGGDELAAAGGDEKKKGGDLPVFPADMVNKWVLAGQQHKKSPEVNWAKSTQFSVRSNSEYLIRKGGYTNDESISIFSLVPNSKGGALTEFVYNGVGFDISSECSKIGIKEFSSKVHVEYGGYKMRPEDKEMCHYYYIWDVGATGFIVESFPGKFTPDSKIETSVVQLGEKIKEDNVSMVIDWLGKDKFGFVLYPGTGAKSFSSYFNEDSKNYGLSYGLEPLSNIGISTSSSTPTLGYLDKSEGFFPSSVVFKYDGVVAAFPLTTNPLEPNKLPNTGLAKIVAAK
ncbi:MAG: hypothetical protein WC506_04090 [Candidatus Micrarchaeia archaeon]